MELVNGSLQLVILLILGLLKCDAELVDKQCLVDMQGIHMNLSRVGIINLPDDVLDSPYVVSLNLSHNHIESISENAFRRLPKLQTLDLSYNRIGVNKVFVRLNHSCLVTLKLQSETQEDLRNTTTYYGYYESIKKLLPRNYHEKHHSSYLPHLKILDLKGSGKDMIELKLKTVAPNLTHLDLSSSNLTSSQFIFDLPSTIIHLILDNNRIQDLSTDMLKNIQELSLGGNLFTQLCVDDCPRHPGYNRGYTRYNNRHPVTISARSLKSLRLSDNAINEIHIKDVSSPFKLLELLDLSNNAIKDMDPAFKDLFPNLKYLLLNNNHLYSIPNVCSMNALERLDLNNNQIGSFSVNSLSINNKLKELQLRNNRIAVLGKDELNKFPTLTNLDLSNNILETLREGWLPANNKLEVLWLTNNRLTNLTSLSLSKLQHLRELHIENNHLLLVRANDIANIAKNLIIYLNLTRSNDCYTDSK